MPLLALTYKKLSQTDFKILRVIEAEMPKYEYVPVEVIERRLNIPSSHVHMSLSKLNRLKLVRRRTGGYTGFRLTWMGLDILALKSLVDRGIIYALGDKLGVGKESDVYSALAPSDKRVIVKFHRAGRTSFQRIVIYRPYVRDKPGVSWMLLAKIAGEREFKALVDLYKVGASVPKPIGYSRHAVVIDYIDGVELYEYQNPEDPKYILKRILFTLRKAYMDVGIVHGDLSEYNVMVTIIDDREEPLIIDWPQYVPRDDPSAESLLRRDIAYILRFFRRRYRISLDEQKALSYVKGEIEELE
ncbi:MAG: RIO1 family regulatory kinase/ATPase [Pyrodictiaceae archaeon]